MTVKEYLESTYKEDDKYALRKRIYCNDGFNISVQGGNVGNYCDPREHCNYYFKVECGFPSAEEELLMPYAENKEEPTETVYGYVPIEVIEEVIKKHGGIV